MTITFLGDEFKSTQRVLTNCHSLDLALADKFCNIGWPLRSVVEIYGPKGVGKSTLAFSIMGMVAKQLGKNVTILDWEGQSKETIEGVLNGQDFFGNVHYMLNVGEETSEDTLERFVTTMWDDDHNIALMDSLAAFRPTAELEGKIGDANIGVHARESGQLTGKLVHVALRSTSPGTVMLTNHVHPKIGSMVQGQDTSGGVKKKYLAHIRLDVNQAYIGNSAVNFGESWLLRGRVDHNRYGYSKREFYVFMLGGEGIHVGLTALWDCVIAGYATLSAKSIRDSVTVSLDGKSYGKMRHIIDHRDDQGLFNDFVNVLKANSLTQSQDDVGEVEEETPKKKGKKK